jgi:hypothetical protein
MGTLEAVTKIVVWSVTRLNLLRISVEQFMRTLEAVTKIVVVLCIFVYIHRCILPTWVQHNLA